jgi:hypothetical protein
MEMNKLDYFTTTIAGVEVCVAGEYEAPDLMYNWNGGFEISKIWIETDLQATDIYNLLDISLIEQLEHEGFTGCAQSKREARQDSLEDRAEAARGIL